MQTEWYTNISKVNWNILRRLKRNKVMQQIGIFQWYSEEKGYGLISTMDSTIYIQSDQDNSIKKEEYDEVFIHIKNWSDKSTIDFKNNPLPLVFDVVFERGKITAKQCRYFNYSVEDFKLLYELTIQHHGKLAIAVKPNNKSTKLVNIIFKQNPVSFTHFNTVLENKLYQVTNDNFFDFIEKLYKYFDKDFIANELIQNSASIRAQETPDDNFFIFELWEKGFLNTNDLTLEVIKKNISKLDIILFKKLISHPDIINIYKMLLERNDFKLVYELINHGMANDSLIEYAVLKVKKIISEIETKSIIAEVSSLLNALDNQSTIKEIVNKEIAIRIKDSDDSIFIFDVWEKGFLNTDDLTLEVIKENIPKFNITLFKKLISHPDVINIYKALLEENNSELIYKLINYGLTIDSLLEYTKMKVQSIVAKVESQNILAEARELLNVINNQSIINEIINKELGTRIKESDDSIFIFDAWEAGYIETSALRLIDIEKNIQKITLHLYEKLKSHPTIDKITWLILSYSKEQILLENIICDLENILEGEFIFELFIEIIHNNLIDYSPENQVLLMKKLFHLRAQSKLNFTAEDMGVFLSENIINAINSHENLIDVSTLLIANILYNFQNKGKFIAEKELIRTVLNSIGSDKSRKIRIDHYFDKCEGIGRIRISDRTNGTITKEKFITSNGEEKYYFKVAFDYIKDIVEAIKKIPGSKYNSDTNYWGVPLRHSDELMTFAKQHRFLIKSENIFQDNSHLVEIYLDKKSKPTDIAFCSGVEAKVPDSSTGMKFWWCAGGRCYQNNIHLHSTEDWQKYTLYDFVNILGLSLEENTGVATVANGLYIQFVTILNRFQKLLEKMYCTECEHVLYPVETSIASAYSVVRFSCINQQCGLREKVVYLNHCLNGQCNAIIDSRESKKCANGLYICHTCGSCCSHAMFERRRDNLLKNGVSIPTDLMQKIGNNSGHLEKAEYFCYKCGQWMQELSDVSYKCRDCDVHYDLSKYPYLKTIRANIESRDMNYPKVSFNNIISKLKIVLLDEKQSLEANGRSEKQIFGILFNKVVKIDGNEISLAMLNNRALTNEVFA